MISALWTGISGLSSAQTALDNESNNIANVNTVGYKASRVSFSDLMYQDSIGKGSQVTSAEKQYTQGSLNLTGSSYDMALDGDGFFVVSNVQQNGTSELYYTRAGNFRMGDNGTLQDAEGNEVQGWAMSALDATSDVTSTNSNWTSFTDDFTSIAGNQIIQFSNKIETYAAKMTDYSSSVESDSEELSGSGIKTASTKTSDIEALITNYTTALEDYAIDPTATSSTSIAQSSTIDFPDSTSSVLGSEGDQVYVYIDGNKITQDYITDYSTTDENRAATYKALADQISNITGLNAYTVDSSDEASTATSDATLGKIKIDSIIPGDSFVIGDIYEASGTVEMAGSYAVNSIAVAGTGEGAVTSAMEALKNAVSGSQYDVYGEDELFVYDATATTSTFTTEDGSSVVLAAGDSFDFTLDGLTTPVSVAITTAMLGSTSPTPYSLLITEMATAINADADMAAKVTAEVINGKLVVTSDETGEEFSGVISFNDAAPTATTYTIEKDLDISGNTGAAAEFMQIVSTLDQTTAKTSLQLKLDTLGLTDSSFGEFSVDDTGLITMTQDGVEFAIGQVAIAQFNNNIGLDAVGDNLLSKTNDSGEAIYTVNNENNVEVNGETLELSTADLSESLVNLMVFQRAFEANAKSITTANELLTTLIGLKR